MRVVACVPPGTALSPTFPIQSRFQSAGPRHAPHTPTNQQEISRQQPTPPPPLPPSKSIHMFDTHREIPIPPLDVPPAAPGQPQHNTGPATQAFSPANPPPAAPDGPANNRPASHSARRRAPAWLCNVDIAPQSSEPAHAQETGPGGKPTRTQPGQAPRPSRGHRQNRSHQ